MRTVSGSASSTSKTTYGFRSAISSEVVLDAEAEESRDSEGSEPSTNPAPEYVEVVDPFAPEISFLKSDCPERKVIRVVCDQLGRYPTPRLSGREYREEISISVLQKLFSLLSVCFFY